MIRYNANSPEILGKKQYNVLRGFGWWCVSCAVGVLYFVYILLFDSPLSSRVEYRLALRVFSVALFTLCAFSSPYFFILAVAIIKRDRYAPRFARLGFVGLFLLGIIIVSLAIVWPHGGRWFFFLFYYCLFIFGFTALFWWGLIRLFRQPFILSCFTVKDAPVVPNAEPYSEPFFFSVFSKWDPLSGYGRLWLILCSTFALILAVISVYTLFVYYLSMQFRYGNYLPESLLSYCLPIAPMVVCAVIGYGLSRHKEWARMLMVLLHVVILCLLLVAVYSTIPYNYLSWIEIGRFLMVVFLSFAVAHWCYFVIRTLTSPVVKYVCLRGGHDID